VEIADLRNFERKMLSEEEVVGSFSWTVLLSQAAIDFAWTLSSSKKDAKRIE